MILYSWITLLLSVEKINVSPTDSTEMLPISERVLRYVMEIGSFNLTRELFAYHI